MSSRTIRGMKAPARDARPASPATLTQVPRRAPTQAVARALTQALLLAVVLGTAGACASSPRTPGPAAGSPSSRTRTPVAPAPSPATLTLDEHTRKTGVTVRTGTTVLVRLHSTYWSTPTTSDPAVLVPGTAGSSPSGTCPPGGGCGVSAARFTAARPGTARITAHRSSCGEAMRCPPGRSGFEVTVTVTR